MLPKWIASSLPTGLVLYIVISGLAATYVAARYRDVRKFLAGAFFVSSGMLCYFWVTGLSIPIVMPLVGLVSVEPPAISGRRAVLHFGLFLLCAYFGFWHRPKGGGPR